MKFKKGFIILTIFVCLIIMNITKVSAINFELEIVGKNKLNVQETIYLVANGVVYNDLYIPDKPNGGMGKVSSEDLTNEAIWTSSNTSVAIVDKGAVTGISAGTAIIKAEHSYGVDTFRIKVENTNIDPTQNEFGEVEIPIEEDFEQRVEEIPGVIEKEDSSNNFNNFNNQNNNSSEEFYVEFVGEEYKEYFLYETEEVDKNFGEAYLDNYDMVVYLYIILINIIVFIIVIILLIIKGIKSRKKNN